MTKLFLLAGAAALMSASPALAEKGKGKGSAKANVAAKVHKGSTARVNARGQRDVNRNGIADSRERWIDVNRDGVDDRRQAFGRYAGQACPPGLAKKSPACVPPGQVGRNGQRVPTDWSYVDYNNIPDSIRDRYDLDDDYRYVYRDRRLYIVDPTTSLITRVLNGIIF